MTLDTVARQVFVVEQPIFFSPREIAVLEHLLRRSGRVVAKTLLEDNLYGLSQEVGSNAVEVYVHRLRKHLAEVGASVHIHTLRGVGYLIAEENEVLRFRSVVSRIIALHLLAIVVTSICMPLALYMMLQLRGSGTAPPGIARTGRRDRCAISTMAPNGRPG